MRIMIRRSYAHQHMIGFQFDYIPGWPPNSDAMPFEDTGEGTEFGFHIHLLWFQVWVMHTGPIPKRP